MRDSGLGCVLGVLLVGAIMGGVVCLGAALFLVMWNWLVPGLFVGVSPIDYGQAFKVTIVGFVFALVVRLLQLARKPLGWASAALWEKPELARAAWGLSILFFVLNILLGAVLSALPFMIWWNWIVVEITPLRSINLFEAFGLNVVAQMLFGPFVASGDSDSDEKKKD